MMCPDNTVKSDPGDITHCNTDPPCDEISRVPDVGHTVCGKNTH